MKCLSCEVSYYERDAGACRGCSVQAEEKIDELKSKINFLRLLYVGPNCANGADNNPCFSDVVVLVASGSDNSPSIQAHRDVLTSRSPVFKAMFENNMEESLSGTIKMRDVSYDVLRAFVKYLYTAEACLDEHMARDLLVLAEKYQVQHLKTYCEKYLIDVLNWENSIGYLAFARQHGAKSLLDAITSLIMDNMDKLSKREEYSELVSKDPRMLMELYEAYVSKQVNANDPATQKK